jgi:hypothetical protein
MLQFNLSVVFILVVAALAAASDNVNRPTAKPVGPRPPPQAHRETSPAPVTQGGNSHAVRSASMPLAEHDNHPSGSSAPPLLPVRRPAEPNLKWVYVQRLSLVVHGFTQSGRSEKDSKKKPQLQIQIPASNKLKLVYVLWSYMILWRIYISPDTCMV